MNILAAARVPNVPARRARTAREAGDAAADLGFPVVIKVLSADILHKSDIGGVRLGVAGRRRRRDRLRRDPRGLP